MTRAEAQAHAEKLFDAMDINHDGKLDKADREARLNQRFDKMDTNHDGQLSRQEFADAHDKMRDGMKMGMKMDHDMPPPPPAGPRGPAGMKGPHRMGPMGHHAGMMMAMGLMREADPGHTGTVTRQAFVDAALRKFDAADTNHDGTISPEERRAAMKAQWGPRGGEGRGPGRGGPGMGQGMGPGPMDGHDMPPPPSEGQ